MKLLTWNTLHIYHEYNHEPSSIIIQKYPNEQNRINKVTSILKQFSNIICLQEVEEDLLNKILSFPNYSICSNAYTRIPKYQNKEQREYLVTLIPTEYNIISCQFEEFCDGKGMQIIKFENPLSERNCNCAQLTIINCHIPYKKEFRIQAFNKIKSHFTTKTVIIGDMNCERIDITPFFPNVVNNPLSTRYNKTIDHLIYSDDIKIDELLRIENIDYSSDHYPIIYNLTTLTVT